MDGMSIRPRPAIVLIAPATLDALWPHWEPLLKRALRHVETHNSDDVRELVSEGYAQLWVQWSGSALEAFIVSEVVTYPRGKWLRLWLAATADGALMDNERFEDATSEFRDAEECKGYEIIGRLGWLKRFRDLRFEGAVMRTTAGDA